MFGKFFKAISLGQTVAEAIRIVSGVYAVNSDGATQFNEMHEIGNMWGDEFNAHDMALMYIVEHALRLDSGDPRSKQFVERFVKLAKSLEARGAFQSPIPRNRLSAVAGGIFGVDWESVRVI